MIGRISRWRHRRRGHVITTTVVTKPMFDPSAKGLLYRCSCQVVWAE